MDNNFKTAVGLRETPMTFNKINNIKITPLITLPTNPDDILGGKLFLDPYSNVAIIAKKRSGKTTTLYHILKKVCRGGKSPTNVIIFASTVNKDKTYEYIKEQLEKKGCNVSTYMNFIDDGENIIEGLLESLSEKDEEKETLPHQPPPVDTNKIAMFGKGINDIDIVSQTRKSAPPKKIGAEYVLIFDDLGASMRHRCIEQLNKISRHYKMRCFFLQQYLTDLSPASRKNLDYALLFKSFNEDKLKNIYESLDLSVDFEDFLRMYQYATKEPYNFFYIDVHCGKYRKNFDTEIIL